MGNGRSPRRSVLVYCCLLAAAGAVLGCQRPLVQRVEPLALTSKVPIERPQTVEVPAALPVGELAPPRPSATMDPPARAAAAEHAVPAAPTPLLDAISAKASHSEVADAAVLDVAETKPDPAHPQPAATTESPVPAAAKQAVVAVPQSAAPPVAGPETKIIVEHTPSSEPEPKSEPPGPDERWRDGLKTLLSVARDRAGKNDDAADEWALRYALVEWLSTADEQPGSTDWRTVVAPLAHSGNGSLSDTTLIAGELHKAIASLENRAPLEVASVELCRRVKGFGSYEPVDVSACKPGRAVIVYCELTGVRYEPQGDRFRSRVSAQVELRPNDGGAPVWTHELGVAEDSSPRRRRDYYVNYRLDLPADLAPGRYDLLVTQTDLATRQSASRTVPVTILP